MKQVKALWVLFVAALAGIITPTQAMAAIPLAATTGITDIITDVGTLEAAIWPLVITVTVALIVIKLFKKFANRGT